MRQFLYKRFRATGMDDEGSTIFSWFLTVTIYCVMIGCFINGLDKANDPKECRVTSIANTVLSFPYALGCNVGKDRWNIKINPEIISE